MEICDCTARLWFIYQFFIFLSRGFYYGQKWLGNAVLSDDGRIMYCLFYFDQHILSERKD